MTVDPEHAFGRPRFTHAGASVDDVLDLFRSGEPVDVVADESGLSRDEVGGRHPSHHSSSRLDPSSTAASAGRQYPRPSQHAAGRLQRDVRMRLRPTFCSNSPPDVSQQPPCIRMPLPYGIAPCLGWYRTVHSFVDGNTLRTKVDIPAGRGRSSTAPVPLIPRE